MYSPAESIIVYPDAGRYICNIKVIVRAFWSREDLYYVSHMYIVILIKSGLFFFKRHQYLLLTHMVCWN